MPGRSPELDPREERWDVVVVGTGMGGASLGYALARRGRKVLFLEKGRDLLSRSDLDEGRPIGDEERPSERLRRGHWPHRIEGETSFGPMRFFAPLGCGTGGSTTLYAAQLERMMPCDLEPRRSHPGARGASLPEQWPVTWTELVPYYREAEQLYGVTGTPDPMNPDPGWELHGPPPMSERDTLVFELLRGSGLHPYRAHVGYRFVSGCAGCGGAICPRGCKSDAATICLAPALQRFGARLVCEAEVVRLEADRSRVRAVVYRRGGAEHRVSGDVVVLAAGSLLTPALLLRSRSDQHPDGLSNRSGMVGCHLMTHATDFFAVRPGALCATEGPPKAISLNDLYLRDGLKMGTLQSVGMTVEPGVVNAALRDHAARGGPWCLHLGRAGRKVASYAGAALFRRSAVLASIVEDLPYRENRVVLDPGAPDGLRFHYRYPAELAERTARFRAALRRALPRRLDLVTLFAGGNNLNFGHLSGTCRGGTDPATSVVDRDNRSHELENLYIADASTFPSSGGTNPSLTIAARALMTARAVDAAL